MVRICSAHKNYNSECHICNATIKLLSCPFCGEKPHVFNHEYSKENFEYQIYCDNCKASIDWYSSIEEAESNWNTRINVDPCKNDCKIKKAVKEYGENITGDSHTTND